MNHINMEFLNVLCGREEGRTNTNSGETLESIAWNKVS